MKLDKQKLARLAEMTLNTRPDEISCDDWLELVSEYLEAVKTGKDIPDRLTEVRRHADTCPECAEELRALLEVTE